VGRRNAGEGAAWLSNSVEPRPVRRNPATGVHVFNGQPTVVFLTVTTLHRGRGLADPKIHQRLVEAWKEADSWLVGSYVLMPDHIHLFCSPRNEDVSIEHWIAFWKRQFRRKCSNAPRFQSRGFHHRLRRDENYSEKLDYVRQNPVRAGLVSGPEEWPYQGVLHELGWW